MRHCISGRKFNRTSSHRKAMFKNLSVSLIEREAIKTTLPKAKQLRVFVEPLITLAKHEVELDKKLSTIEVKSKIAFLRRQAFNYLRNKTAVKKLFEEIGPRYQSRYGGYVRIHKYGYRSGDKAPMALVQLV